jgi:hypothetical protein
MDHLENVSYQIALWLLFHLFIKFQNYFQVGEVVDIMRVNVEKVLERDQKISELDKRADDLQVKPKVL